MTQFFPNSLLAALLLCSAPSLFAQIHKGATLLEAGAELHLEGKFGLKDVDLSQSGFRYFEQDYFMANVAVGKFVSARREIIGLMSYERKALLNVYTSSFLGSTMTVERLDLSDKLSLGLGFRQYYPLKIKRLYGGFAILPSAYYGWDTLREEQIDPVPAVPETTLRQNNWGARINANLFVAYWLGEHLGVRTSLGNLGFSVSKLSTQSYYQTAFDLSLRNSIFSQFSLFWLFHGKSKDDRD
jgi:hypothetical protein